MVRQQGRSTTRARHEDTHIATKSLLAVATHVNGAGYRTKQWTSSRGRSFGGNRFSTGPHLVHALGQAFLRRAELLRTGDSMDVLAARRRASASQVKKLLGLTNLSPRVIRTALTAGLPPRVSVNDLVDAGQHLDWPRQEARLGLMPQQHGAAKA